MYDNEILSGLEDDISTYITTPVTYVRSIQNNDYLEINEKINSLLHIVATPITKSNSFSELPINSKRIWVAVAHISSVDYIANHITYVNEYERSEIIMGLITSLINSYENVRPFHGIGLGQPTTEVLILLQVLKKLYKSEMDHLGRHISFPLAFYQHYTECIDYMVRFFNFDWYCCDHKMLMMQIKDVDVDTSLWENEYIKLINRVKLTRPHDTVAYQMVTS